MFHTGTFVMIAVVFRLLWQHASSRNRLLVPGTDPQEVGVLNRISALAPILYLASFFLASVSPLGSTLLNSAIVVIFVMLIP